VPKPVRSVRPASGVRAKILVFREMPFREPSLERVGKNPADPENTNVYRMAALRTATTPKGANTCFIN
jgi:hypothetical protein